MKMDDGDNICFFVTKFNLRPKAINNIGGAGGSYGTKKLGRNLPVLGGSFYSVLFQSFHCLLSHVRRRP